MSVQKTEEAYYNLLAGGARYALFTSLCDLYLPAILGSGDKSAEEIIAALGIAPHRGRKWLHALHLAGFLDKLPRPGGGEQVNGLDPPPRYRLGELIASMFGENGYGGWFFREFLRYYRTAVAYPLPSVLYGMQLAQPVRYPPVDSADTHLLHDWMRSAALDTLAVIRRYVDFERYERLLDVGGGDGTMALQLYRSFPRLIITVFNMPQPTDMVQQLAEKNNAWDRIGGIAGDFRTDPLPGGNDAVMFSRVLADWPPELCRRLLQKAHKALADDGHLIICEPLYDHNPDLCLVWEHSYVPYDDFGLQCYKPLSLYERLLKETGFELVSVHPPNEETIHCVILARRLDVSVAIDPPAAPAGAPAGDPAAAPAPEPESAAPAPESESASAVPPDSVASVEE
jgi:SAM-dependent methyltransferase